MKIFLIIGIILIGAFIGSRFLVPSAPKVSQLGGNAFIESLNKTPGALLLDVRTKDEFAVGHIASARNVDFEAPSFLEEIQKLDKSVPYYLYCRSGNRSGQAVKIMTSNGFKNITELQGGIVSNSQIPLIPLSEGALGEK